MTDTPDQSSWGEYLAGLLVGVGVGAIVALLYAPKPGKETRAEILTRLDDLKQRVDATAKELADKTKATLAETTADLSEAMEAGRKAARARAQTLRKETGMTGDGADA